jgi:hypothetical protein
MVLCTLAKRWHSEIAAPGQASIDRTKGYLFFVTAAGTVPAANIQAGALRFENITAVPFTKTTVWASELATAHGLTADYDAANTTLAISVQSWDSATGTYVYEAVAGLSGGVVTPAEYAAQIVALPTGMYRAVGALLEELAAAYYKGTGPTDIVTANERAALVRLQDKVIKSEIESIGRVRLRDGGTYANMSVDVTDLSIGVLRVVAPTISGWLFDGVPVGTPLLTLT